MNTERDDRGAFKAAEDGLREAGLDAKFILRNIATADDRSAACASASRTSCSGALASSSCDAAALGYNDR
jgi:hypothetical protein